MRILAVIFVFVLGIITWNIWANKTFDENQAKIHGGKLTTLEVYKFDEEMTLHPQVTKVLMDKGCLFHEEGVSNKHMIFSLRCP